MSESSVGAPNSVTCTFSYESLLPVMPVFARQGSWVNPQTTHSGTESKCSKFGRKPASLSSEPENDSKQRFKLPNTFGCHTDDFYVHPDGVQKRGTLKAHMATLPKRGQIKVTAMEYEIDNPGFYDKHTHEQPSWEKPRKRRPKTGKAYLIRRPEIQDQIRIGDRLLSEERRGSAQREDGEDLSSYTVRDLTKLLTFSDQVAGRRGQQRGTLLGQDKRSMSSPVVRGEPQSAQGATTKTNGHIPANQAVLPIASPAAIPTAVNPPHVDVHVVPGQTPVAPRQTPVDPTRTPVAPSQTPTANVTTPFFYNLPPPSHHALPVTDVRLWGQNQLLVPRENGLAKLNFTPIAPMHSVSSVSQKPSRYYSHSSRKYILAPAAYKLPPAISNSGQQHNRPQKANAHMSLITGHKKQ